MCVCFFSFRIANVTTSNGTGPQRRAAMMAALGDGIVLTNEKVSLLRIHSDRSLFVLACQACKALSPELDSFVAFSIEDMTAYYLGKNGEAGGLASLFPNARPVPRRVDQT